VWTSGAFVGGATRKCDGVSIDDATALRNVTKYTRTWAVRSRELREVGRTDIVKRAAAALRMLRERGVQVDGYDRKVGPRRWDRVPMSVSDVYDAARSDVECGVGVRAGPLPPGAIPVEASTYVDKRGRERVATLTLLGLDPHRREPVWHPPAGFRAKYLRVAEETRRRKARHALKQERRADAAEAELHVLEVRSRVSRRQAVARVEREWERLPATQEPMDFRHVQVVQLEDATVRRNPDGRQARAARIMREWDDDDDR
jgi:hypothetical protein